MKFPTYFETRQASPSLKSEKERHAVPVPTEWDFIACSHLIDSALRFERNQVKKQKG